MPVAEQLALARTQALGTPFGSLVGGRRGAQMVEVPHRARRHRIERLARFGSDEREERPQTADRERKRERRFVGAERIERGIDLGRPNPGRRTERRDDRGMEAVAARKGRESLDPFHVRLRLALAGKGVAAQPARGERGQGGSLRRTREDGVAIGRALGRGHAGSAKLPPRRLCREGYGATRRAFSMGSSLP